MTRASPGVLAATLVLVIGSYAALSIDVPRTGLGIKGDEATYVAMALSLAHDGDLAFEARDLERFYRVYGSGPEGIFLKRGATASYQFEEAFPFVRRQTRADDQPDRLYFGKAFISSVAAAPFVRLAGLNGLLLFHTLLVAGMIWLGSVFLSTRSAPGPAAGYTAAFFGASIVPIYAIWWTSETFNVACVFLAYFLWFYKEVRPVADRLGARLIASPMSDIVAAVVLGLATFSKPVPNGLLLIPPVALAFYRRRYLMGIGNGGVAVVVVALCFAINAGISGEFNYQGGLDRRTFYTGSGGFPFEVPGVPFEQIGIQRATNQVVVEERLSPGDFLTLLMTNGRYFVAGRHFGFVPFFFPGVITIGLFLWRRASREVWQWLVLGTVALCAVGLMVYMPYTWSGGGGPPGNRYFLSAYPALFFITPPLASVVPALAAVFGGTLFIVQILVNPFVAAKQPYLNVERGPLRLLPVELTMVNDLPIMLDAGRARVRYGHDPTLLLYYLDHNAYLPESPGIWVMGGRRADLIVRTDHRPLETVQVTLNSRVANRVYVELGGDSVSVELEAGRPRTVTLEPRGVYARRSWAYLLSVETRDGFVPRLVEPDSGDRRYLGVAVRLDAVSATVAERAGDDR